MLVTAKAKRCPRLLWGTEGWLEKEGGEIGNQAHFF